MKLFVVTDRDRWGYSINLVRATDADESKRLVCPKSRYFDVEELPEGTEARILWVHDDSPDTSRGDDE